ncbi:MAG: hypothetical protein ACFE9L_10635 [Candidatus Hodarchaeota archaeon]
MTNFQIIEAALQNSFQAQQEIQALKDQLQQPIDKGPGKLSKQQELLLDIIRNDLDFRVLEVDIEKPLEIDQSDCFWILNL